MLAFPAKYKQLQGIEQMKVKNESSNPTVSQSLERNQLIINEIKIEMENQGQNKVQLSAESVQTAEILKDERGHWVPGVSGNPKGRTKGTLTRKTAIMQAFCDDILTGGAEKFKTELNKLEGKEFVNAYLNLLEYAMPKMARVEHTGDGDSFKVTQVFKIGSVEVKL